MAQAGSPAFAGDSRYADLRGSDPEVADIIARLGPIADQQGSRAAVAQFEADIADPGRSRAGSSFAGSTGPLPRFMPMRDIVRISLNIIDVVPSSRILQRLARTTRLPTDDNVTNALAFAPTLRDAQLLSVRYGNMMLPWFRRRVIVSGGEVKLIYQPVTPLGRIEPITTELSLTTSQRIIETFIGPAAAGARMHFAVQPESDPALISERSGCHVTVGGDESHIAFPLGWWAQPNPFHDPARWREGVARCEADLVAVCEAPLVARVRAHVAAGLDERQIVTIAETARTLDVSTRSLIRVLAGLGTTHHAIVDRERRDRAEALLAQSLIPLVDISEQLAFSDRSSFGRKCLGWFGLSPARLRQQLTGRTRPSA